MTWMIREDRLDPEQRDFINVEYKKNGNIWVRGFAGSGKSVLLVHSLKEILKKEPNSKVAVVVFTRSLIDMFKTGMKEVDIPSTIPVMTYYEFVKNQDKFDYVFCDEVQDLPSKVLYAMQNRVRKIIVAGDSNQSIYERDPKWGEEVVNPVQIGDIISARAFNLNYVHRLTRSIIGAVHKLLPSMNIWGSKRDTTKQDVMIRLSDAPNEKEEVKYVYQEASKWVNIGDTSVILFPTTDTVTKFSNLILNVSDKSNWNIVHNQYGKPNFGNLNNHLRTNGIKLQFVGSGYGSFEKAQKNKEIIMMTYHSSKGLDFDNVFLPFLNNNLPLHPKNAKTVFMVAMTRSRKNLYLTYCGCTHDFVDIFKNDCTKISIADRSQTAKTNATVSGNNINPFDDF